MKITKNSSTFHAIILFIAALFAFSFFAYGGLNKVHANVLEQEVTPFIAKEMVVTPKPVNSIIASTNLGAEILNDDFGISDTGLYNSLIALYNSNNPDEPVTKVYVNMFENETSLNLQNRLIYSLSGLSQLYMPNLESLNVSKNRLSSLTTELIEFTNLKSLNLFDNELTNISLTNLTKLEDVNLVKNNLSSINLSGITKGIVRLSFNKFVDFSKITLPYESAISSELTIELMNNNLNNVSENVLNSTKINLELGLQGVGLNHKENVPQENRTIHTITSSSTITYYNFAYYNITTKIYNAKTNALVLELTNSATADFITFTLSVGEYKVEYINNESQAQAYISNHEIYGAFKNVDTFKVVPSQPDHQFLVNGTYYDSYDGKIPGGTKLVFTTSDQDAVIYYKLPNQDWKQGTEVKLPNNGTYYVLVKSVIGEYESFSYSITVSSSVNAILPDFLTLILIIAVGALLLFGAVPLIKKYFY